MKSHRLKLVILVLVLVSATQSAYPDYGGEGIVDTVPAVDSYQVQLQSEPSASSIDYDFFLEGGDNATDETAAMTTIIPEYIKKNRTEEESITNILYVDDSESMADIEPKGRHYEIPSSSEEERNFMGAMPVVVVAAATTSKPLYHPQIPSAIFFPQPSTAQPADVVAPSPTSSPPPPPSSAATAARSKQGKKIHIKKLLPHEQLRNYIEDAYIRMPLAVIVDPSPAALDKTKNLWGDTLRSNIAIKIVLVSLNSSGECFLFLTIFLVFLLLFIIITYGF